MKLPPLNFTVPQSFVEQALDQQRVASQAGAGWTFTNSRPPKGLNATPAPVEEAAIVTAVITAASKMVHPDFKHFAVTFTSARGDEGIQAHIQASVDPIDGGTEVATEQPVEEAPAVVETKPATVAEAPVTETKPVEEAATTAPAANEPKATTLADVMAAEAADETQVPEAGTLFSAALAADPEPASDPSDDLPAGSIFAGFTKPDNSAGE